MMLRHSLLYLPAQVIGPLMQLVAMVVWTHLVDDHTLGVITLVIATHELLQVAFLAWWSQFALRFFGRFLKADDTERFFRTENAVLCASIVLQSIFATVILLSVVAPGSKTALISATIAYVMTRTLTLYVSERARVSHQIGIYSVQQILGPTLGFAAGWVLVELIGPAPEWVLAGFAIAQFAAVALVLPFLNFSFRLRPVDRDVLKHALHYGAPLIIGGALSWFGLNAPRFIVNDLLGVAAAGLFAVGYGLGQRAAAVAAMLVTAAAYPLAVRKMEEKGSAAAMRQLADNGALLIAIIVPTVVGIFMLRQDIVALLIAEPFRATTLAILPLSVLSGGIRSARAHFCDQVFLLHNRTRLAVLVTGVDAVAALGFGIAGTLIWGLMGAAMASVAAAAIAALVSLLLGATRFHLQVPWSHLVRIALASTAMGAGMMMLPHARSIAFLIVYVGLGAAIYLLSIGLLYLPWLLRRVGGRVKLSAAE
ncbi:lipopolysaccharide biosynthesis protein [Bradyrhizobium sp. LHD-71]|uniref:lipopolysaccharide biosynthesis protein n=1 Tax=Bradyrhizobium sp. LHD-71 TaxID=3072141 RepID=UPI00280F432F|nr:lipopolysaccharide biosynthesis protein [Bradyrhizobium sp. LHD-71]MDQ8729769.1 lipopolysaccharide biosynthesis protein [Bradyrhizobium sp. LHD-71]